jgi:hypothetical protein
MARAKTPAAPSAVKSFELVVGVISIVVGLAGLYATVLTFPGALNAVGSALSGSGLPESFKGLAGAVTLFSVILGGVVALAALFVGLTCMCALVFGLLNVSRPLFAGFLLTLFFFWAAAEVTILMYSLVAAGALLILSFFSLLFIGLAMEEPQ